MSDDDFTEIEIGDWPASLDQARSALRDLAKGVRSYYEGLVEAGFTNDEAFSIAAAWGLSMTKGGGA